MPKPSVDPKKTVLAIMPNKIIEKAKLSIAKKIPLNFLTKKPSTKDNVNPDNKAVAINTSASLTFKKLYVSAKYIEEDINVHIPFVNKMPWKEAAGVDLDMWVFWVDLGWYSIDLIKDYHKNLDLTLSNCDQIHLVF